MVHVHPTITESASFSSIFSNLSKFTNMTSSPEEKGGPPSLVIATRLHLGRATAPPTQLQTLIDVFEDWTAAIPDSVAVIAVDATPKIPNYDYVQAVRECCANTAKGFHNCKVLPVTPWGKFSPALNALVTYAARDLGASHICFVSAEVTPSIESIQMLRKELRNPDVLVVGAKLPGHDYFGGNESVEATPKTPAKKQTTNVVEKDGRKIYTETVTISKVVVGGELNGRTCPWNTLAIWNLKKLVLTGFSMVSDMPDCAGIEECVAIALQQKFFGETETKAILMPVPGVDWEEEEYFKDDPRRKKWHDQKMKSKLDRAAKQMNYLNLEGGTVIHK